MTPPRDNPRDAALAVVDKLRAAGHTAYLAGGCVRDALLGLDPKDYDVATDAAPDRVQSLFRSTAAVGAAFGVVLVYIPKPGKGRSGGRHTIEVATFRADGHYADGRRPDAVRFTTAEEDAKRRDFTINGLFADPPPEDAPGGTPDTIIDFVGGQQDLKAGVIRAIGDPSARFGEDYLRMLRAVRFAARLGFAIEPATAEAIKEHAPKLDQIARERIGDEVRRMVSATPPASLLAADWLMKLGLASVILKAELEPSPQRLLPTLDPAADYPTRLVAWMHDLGADGKADGYAQARVNLALSNDETVAAQATARVWAQLETAWDDAGTAQRKRIAAHPRFVQAVMLRIVQDNEQAMQVIDQVNALIQDGIGLAPPPLVTGDDLIAMGLKPGPRFKLILDDVYDAQLEGRVRTKDEALAFAQGLADTP